MAKMTRRERSIASKLGAERHAHDVTREQMEGYRRRVWRAKKETARVRGGNWAPGVDINGPDLVARLQTAQLLGMTAEIKAVGREIVVDYVKREDA